MCFASIILQDAAFLLQDHEKTAYRFMEKTPYHSAEKTPYRILEKTAYYGAVKTSYRVQVKQMLDGCRFRGTKDSCMRP